MSILLVALAVALRLTWVLAVPTRPVGDFAMYLESAAHLVALTKNPKVAGIGETGLDYYYEHSPKDEQQRAFLIDGQVYSCSFFHAVVIQVAAPGPQPTGAKGLVRGRCDTDAAQHWLQFHLEILEPFCWFR